MKTEIHENQFGFYIESKPETVEEVAMLARYALNCNSEKPTVYMSFSGTPSMNIALKKKKTSVQKNSISNY